MANEKTPVVWDDSTKKHRPLGTGEKMGGLDASSILSSDSGNLLQSGSDGLAYLSGSGIADPAADNLLETSDQGRLKLDMDRVVEWLDGHPQDAAALASGIRVVSEDSGNLVSSGSDGGAFLDAGAAAAAVAGEFGAGADIGGAHASASGTDELRSLSDRFADVVNVKDYGAKGDGTTDDLEAFLAAARTGKRVFVPSGTYRVSGSVAGEFFSDGFVAVSGGGFVGVQPLALSGDEALARAQERVSGRINSRSTFVSYLYLPDGTYDWGTSGTAPATSAVAGSVMFDPYTDDVYAVMSYGGSDSGSRCVIRRFRWQTWTAGGQTVRGLRCVASSAPVWSWPGDGAPDDARVLDHQGYGLYRPNADSPLRFFNGSYGPTADSGPNWYTLRLVEWDGQNGTAPSVVQTWQLFDTSQFRASNTGANNRMNVCLSPDMRKLAARGRRIGAGDTAEESYGGYVYRVWDVKALLAMSGDYADATAAYEASVESPFGSKEADWQGLAFDGRNFYGLFSRGGYSKHYVSVWDLDGNVVARRSPTMEGGVEQPALRQFEGEGLTLNFNAAGECDLYLSVSINSTDWSTNKVAAIYNLTHAGIDADMNRYDSSYLFDGAIDIDNILDTSIRFADSDSTNNKLYNYGVLSSMSAPDSVNGFTFQALYDGHDLTQSSIRRGQVSNDGTNKTVTWGDWNRFLVLFPDDVINLYHYNLKFVKNTGTGGNHIIKTKFYDDDRGGIYINSNYTGIEDLGGQVAIAAGASSDDGYELYRFMKGYMRPESDGTCYLGTSEHRWGVFYCADGTIHTSDAREKDNLAAPDEALMRAWGRVNFKVFQMKAALAAKGASARLHVGLVAQEVRDAFAAEGLDAFRYGLLCYDEWDDEYETDIVLDAEAVLDEEGNVVEPERTHEERRLITKAGSRFGIRYEEALALECAYQRRLVEKLAARVAALEAAN